ncbi:MAG: Gfo/Idh/MocA family oxidoreductase [Chloroflexota bacterium]
MRITVLGCGSIGQRHLRNLYALGYTDLVAFDPVPTAHTAIGQELGINHYSTLTEVWDTHPNVAFITAPSHLHIDLALEATKHHCHIFIEKPLSHTLENTDTLYNETNQRQLITMVGCTMRFHPGPAQIKKLIERGVLGHILSARIETGSYLPGWRPHLDYRDSYSASVVQGGGAIMDQIHEIDLALWYFGRGQVKGAVSLPAQTLDIAVEGLAELLILHDSGILSSVHLNFVQRDYRRSCQIIGSEGTLYWDFQAGQVSHYKNDNTWEIFHQPDDWTINQMYVDEISYFMECITNQQSTFNDITQAQTALDVALAAKQSILE